MKITDKYVFFWNGIYSQWYQELMIVDGIEYHCCEQYMMHQKALTFNDFDIAEKVMQTTHPNEQKALGRQIKNFNVNEWSKVNFGIVYKGNLAKFSQNQILKQELLSTGNKLLVEASPYDQIWGIGLGEDAENIDNPANWRGQNLLGWAITLVKQELQNI